jgi:hypothetical protein
LTSTEPRYDSRPETLTHSLRVGQYMTEAIKELAERCVVHDLSKTLPPEVEYFDRMTPKLATLEYGSDEYRQSLADLAPALKHHYEHNRHHPEHHPRGVNSMTLVDLIEMLSDWQASTERMGGTGDLRRSIVINTGRFGLQPQLVDILLATAEHFGWIKPAGE